MIYTILYYTILYYTILLFKMQKGNKQIDQKAVQNRINKIQARLLKIQQFFASLQNFLNQQRVQKQLQEQIIKAINKQRTHMNNLYSQVKQLSKRICCVQKAKKNVQTKNSIEVNQLFYQLNQKLNSLNRNKIKSPLKITFQNIQCHSPSSPRLTTVRSQLNMKTQSQIQMVKQRSCQKPKKSFEGAAMRQKQRR